MLVEDPVSVEVHEGIAGIPPRGTSILKVKEEPSTVPPNVPLKTTVPSGVLAIIVPRTSVPVCVSVHFMVPGPLESDALPLHVPVKSTAGAGVTDCTAV